MSSNEIRQLWEYRTRTRQSVNINCGQLRGIGKTLFLKQLITESKNNSRNTIALMTPNSSFTNQYRDLLQTNIINYIITDRQNLRNLLQTTLVFSDEVPNAEFDCRQFRLNFVAGVYSIDQDHASFWTQPERERRNIREEYYRNQEELYYRNHFIHLDRKEIDNLIYNPKSEN
jgi:hypothetical protein